MHMSDALVSPAVAGVTSIVSVSLLAVAVWKVKAGNNESLVPLMGVMGAFIFAAQMINFTIPGTGASGHLIGGVLLAAVLGPWAALIVMTSVLIIQCLLFADGGLAALGCNVFNMAVCSCFIAYPLVFRPLVHPLASTRRLFIASVASGIVALELGAFAVTLETEASGVTALPMVRFLLFMLPIHLLIGIGEGLATGAILAFLNRYRPELFLHAESSPRFPRKGVWIGIGIAVILAVCGYLWASSLPDGLEWSIERTTEGG